jgi:hypothetical protein
VGTEFLVVKQGNTDQYDITWEAYMNTGVGIDRIAGTADDLRTLVTDGTLDGTFSNGGARENLETILGQDDFIEFNEVFIKFNFDDDRDDIRLKNVTAITAEDVEPLDLHFEVTLTDGDGDTSVDDFTVTLDEMFA